MFGDFLPLPMDSLVNQAAKYLYISNEQASVPLVVRSAVGGGGRFGAIHSQNPISWFLGVPGLKIVAPSTPSDAFALLVSAIRDDNPVLFLEHKRLYAMRGGAAPGRPRHRPRGDRARGTDITLVSAMKTVHDCLAAAELLAEDGIDAEVLDLRTLRPLDRARSSRRSRRTNRIAVVEEGPLHGRLGGRGARRRRRGRPRRHRRGLAHHRRPTTRSPTARRSRTRSCRTPARSPRTCGRASRTPADARRLPRPRRDGPRMARRLERADVDLVVHNRSPRPAEEFAARGVAVAATPAAAAAGADVCLTMLADGRAVDGRPARRRRRAHRRRAAALRARGDEHDRRGGVRRARRARGGGGRPLPAGAGVRATRRWSRPGG